MTYKLIASDIDNTLIEMYHDYLSDYCIETLNEITEKGVLFVPNTGRSLGTLPKNIHSVSVKYAILGNGTCIYDFINNKALKRFNINPNHIRHLFELTKDIKAIFMAFIDDDIYIDSDISGLELDDGEDINDLLKFYIMKDNLIDYIEENKLRTQKICIITNKNNKRIFLNNINGKYDDLYITSFSETSIEITSNQTDKGKALKFLCDYLNIDLNDVVVSGDGENDYPMMEIAGYSITPDNGYEPLKKIAKLVSDNASDNGVCKAYRNLFKLD